MVAIGRLYLQNRSIVVSIHKFLILLSTTVRRLAIQKLSIAVFLAVIAIVIGLATRPDSASANSATVINDSLAASDVATVYDPTPADNAAAGVFTINAIFTNTSPDSFIDLFFDVAVLSGDNVVLNCDDGPAGVGCTVTVDADKLGPGGVLSPGESFSVEFQIGLKVMNSFEFLVNAWESSNEHICSSVNGILELHRGDTSCISTESDGLANIAMAVGSGSSAKGGFSGTDSGNLAFAQNGGFTQAGHGDDNTAKADGQGAWAAAGNKDNNFATASGANARAEAAAGNNNTAIAVGDNATAQANGGDSNVANATGYSASANTLGGDNNKATAIGDAAANAGSGDNNIASAEGDGAFAEAWSGNDNVAIAEGDCYALAMGGNQTNQCVGP